MRINSFFKTEIQDLQKPKQSAENLIYRLLLTSQQNFFKNTRWAAIGTFIFDECIQTMNVYEMIDNLQQHAKTSDISFQYQDVDSLKQRLKISPDFKRSRVSLWFLLESFACFQKTMALELHIIFSQSYFFFFSTTLRNLYRLMVYTSISRESFKL